ncbi:retrotransposon protein [Hordeum vulgare]|nr:retrotransposon protein [Hordeum vulgare]
MSLVPYGGGGGGAMSLPVPPLTAMNYTPWAIKVEAFFDAQGLWCAVSSAEGVEVDADKCRTARDMLLGALSEQVLLQVSTKLTARGGMGLPQSVLRRH